MVKGIGIAFAILVFSFLPGVAGKAFAKTTSITTKELGQKNCKLPQYSLLASLKKAHFTTNSNESNSFVPTLFTTGKVGNGALVASIGVSVADPNDQAATAQTPILSAPATTTPSPEVQGASAQVQSIPGGLNADAIFAMVNEHRAQMGLPPFQKSDNLTQIAKERTPELQNEMYGGAGMHAGFYNRHLPYWATENIISQKTEADAVNWWLHSPIHRSAIEGNYTNASVACQGNNCSMIFTSFAPKE